MPNYNRANFIGHLAADPQLKYTPQGKAVCNFSIGVNAGKKDEKPTWVRVTLWEKVAETAAQYLKKGDPVMVGGPIKLSSYTNQNNGVTYTNLEITAYEMVMLKSGGGRQAEAAGPAAADDDIPF